MKKTIFFALILMISLLQNLLYSLDPDNKLLPTNTPYSDVNFEITVLRGNEILPFIPAIAQLRIDVFREYPYLYEGDLAYEERYLKMYSLSEHAMIVLAKEGDQVIGAITGVPIVESMDEIKELFLEKKLTTAGVYYLGEIVLLKPYRKKKIGFAMYEEFEKTVRKMGSYHQIALCEIDRSSTDPKRPREYTSLDDFWTKQGYVKHPSLITHFSYLEIGNSEETLHPMVFWTKNLK